MKLDETRRVYSLIGVLGITLMFFLMLVNIAGASPFAYITDDETSTVSVIDTATNTVTATVRLGWGAWGVAVNPDGTKVYITGSGKKLVVIDTATNTVTANISVKSDMSGVAVNPDGTKVYVAHYSDSIVSVIDTATNNVTATVPVGSHPHGVAVNPDGTKVYVANMDDGSVSVIDTATNKVTATVTLGKNSPFGVAVNPDGKKVYVASPYPGNVFVIDTATNKVIATVPSKSNSWGVAVTPDGTKVYVTELGSRNVSVIDTATNTITATVHVGSTPCGVAVTPDGTKVYVVNSGNGSVSVIDTATNTVTVTIRVGKTPIAFGQFIDPLSSAPFANFSAKPTEGKAPLTVTFTDTSTGTSTKWKWSFGDGTSSTIQNPTHTYSAAGKYTVTLTVTNAKGNNTTTETDYIKVIAKPVANFTSSVTSGKAPFNVFFTDTSTGTPSGWAWDFGDGSRSFVQNPTHKYSRVGIYTVNLTVKNAIGRNTVTKTDYIKVTEKPVAEFSATPTSGKAPLTVTFTDTSAGLPTKWKWNFGDGTTSVQQNPIHKYLQSGNYTVALTAESVVGSNTVINTNYIVVVSKPVAAFSAYPTSGKAPLTVAFTDKSSGNPTAYKWSFGDGTVSREKNPKHQYLQAGKYKITFTVKNASGGSTITKTNYITVTTNTRPSIYTEGK